MKNALSGRIGTGCGALQDRLLDKSSPLFNMPCASSGAPPLLNFSQSSVFQKDCAGSILFPPLSFPLPFTCSLLYTQTSRICSGWQIQLLLCFAPPSPSLFFFSSSRLPVVCSQPVVVLCSGFALTNPQPQFLCVFWSGSYLQTLCCEQSIFMIRYSGDMIGQ